MNEDDFNYTFILFEREIRYRQAEEDNFLIEIAESHSQKIYIETDNTSFKENVLESFARALNLPSEELGIAQGAFFENERTTIAEGIINFCKKTNNENYEKFIMDWVDYEKTARQENWNSLVDLYKWTSLLYQFGVALPVSLLDKILDNFNENELFNLQDFFDSEEFENLPLILEGNTLRTRHELIAGWHVEKELKTTQYSRLGKMLRAVDVQDALERSIYIALLGRKNIVKGYITKLTPNDFETLLKNAARYSITQRLGLMAEGWVYSFRNELEKARETFKSATEIDSQFLPAILETAKTEFYLNNFSEAEKLLNELLKLDKNNLHARTELGKVYQALGKYDEAEKILLECINISSNDLNSRNELAIFYRSQKNFEAAEKVLKECISISPKDLNSRTELAKLYQVQGRNYEAISTLKDLLKHDSTNIFARNELSKVYQALGKYDEAEKVLLECINISPEDLNSRTELGKVYQVLGKYDEAEKILKDLLELDKDNLQARTELGKVYQALGRYNEAEKRLLEYLELDPKGLQPRTELGKVYQALGKYDEAEKVLLEALEINDKQLQPRTELGKVYQALGKYDEAEKILLESLEIDAKQLHPRTELARVYIGLRLFRKARSVAVEFLQNKSEEDNREIAHLFLTYLNACYQMQRYHEGVNLIDKYACQFLSPQLAEEYGRLFRNYDLKNAIKFFLTASRTFNKSSRLLSEAAICLKLGGKAEAESILETAIRLESKKENKYRKLYKEARLYKQTDFRYLDHTGIIININYETMTGIVGNKTENYSFRWDDRLSLPYSKLKINDVVFFDVTNRNYAINIEPIF